MDVATAWATRLQIHKQALKMCKKDKEAFRAELIETQTAIQVMMKPAKFTELTAFPKNLGASLD